MYLDRIKISGFKSFADEVELILGPGVTAIVGPNGCGKSNISDAIRWVLGEQRARSLRCANMRDVLFNGGSDLQPTSKAEVSIRFAEVEGKLALESPEIEVTRQLTRDGQSNYLINRTPSRLKDINELFMDTGIGTDAYSIMEQSKIDFILNVRPEDRRAIFDEVAGINGYKHRKKEILRKITSTEQNIVRINDLIVELQRETASLKIQADQAELYQKLHDELRRIELQLNRIEFDRFVKNLSGSQINLDEILSIIAIANDTIESTEIKIESANQNQIELDQQMRRQHQIVRELEQQIEKTEREITLFKERQINIHQQRERAVKAIETLENQLADLSDQKKTAEDELRKIESDLNLDQNLLIARRRVLDNFTTQIRTTETKINSTRSELRDAELKSAEIEKQILSIDNKLEYSESDHQRIDAETKKIRSELESVSSEKSELQKIETGLATELLKSDQRRSEIKTSLTNSQNELRKIEAEIRGSQDSLGMNVSRLRSLKNLQNAHEGYHVGVRAILKAKELQADQFRGICGVVAELLYTEPKYEIAIEVALGGALQNVITETAEDAQNAINFLKRSKAGRVTFLPLDILKPRFFDDDRLLDLRGVIGIAGELIDCDEKFDVAFDQLLGNTLVVDNIETAISLTRKHRPRSRLVTLDGEVINASGAITGGHKSRQSSGLLSRSRELEELQNGIDQLSKSVSQKDLKRKKLVARIAELQQEQQKINSIWQEKQVEHKSSLRELDQIKKRSDQLQSEFSDAEIAKTELSAQKLEIEIDRDQLQTELDEIKKRSGILERRSVRLSEQIESERIKMSEINRSCQTLEIAVAGKREKVESVKTAIISHEANEKQLKRNIKDQREIIDSDEDRRQELADRIAESQTRFLSLEQSRFENDQRADELQNDRDRLTTEIAEDQKNLRSLRRQFEKHNKMRHQLEVTTTQLQMQIKNISAAILDKYQVAIDEVELSEIEIVEPSQIAILKSEIDDLGTVNLKAIEAYAEQKKREEFQIAQRNDLEKSLNSMHDAIQKLNQTARDEFQITFDQVRSNFQEVFVELFGGGETELILTESEDALESGVEIIACPPGKRPQTITQLSGGERSLVAIALLFAMFKIKPSPFCVMDEVDATLDESNVLRFTNLIRKYADQTQFVIITHNKRTIETADVIYGVTMEQAGVSKLISAKFS